MECCHSATGGGPEVLHPLTDHPCSQGHALTEKDTSPWMPPCLLERFCLCPSVCLRSSLPAGTGYPGSPCDLSTLSSFPLSPCPPPIALAF
ncbi:hypothetical protein CgunFtcFv8_018218 [Champsocephalus gunnari]|uniref:Uncharacterized protein n=1 Tax=Champsocephalus gunnari TaxID=52237 RepID=A0AAN8HS76_CHAGU|nr:hypothetical protein CgunFtcFv8_018218 [Champsocephalus gunnari]